MVLITGIGVVTSIQQPACRNQGAAANLVVWNQDGKYQGFGQRGPGNRVCKYPVWSQGIGENFI